MNISPSSTAQRRGAVVEEKELRPLVVPRVPLLTVFARSEALPDVFLKQHAVLRTQLVLCLLLFIHNRTIDSNASLPVVDDDVIGVMNWLGPRRAIAGALGQEMGPQCSL